MYIKSSRNPALRAGLPLLRPVGALGGMPAARHTARDSVTHRQHSPSTRHPNSHHHSAYLHWHAARKRNQKLCLLWRQRAYMFGGAYFKRRGTRYSLLCRILSHSSPVYMHAGDLPFPMLCYAVWPLRSPTGTASLWH